MKQSKQFRHLQRTPPGCLPLQLCQVQPAGHKMLEGFCLPADLGVSVDSPRRSQKKSEQPGHLCSSCYWKCEPENKHFVQLLVYFNLRRYLSDVMCCISHSVTGTHNLCLFVYIFFFFFHPLSLVSSSLPGSLTSFSLVKHSKSTMLRCLPGECTSGFFFSLVDNYSRVVLGSRCRKSLQICGSALAFVPVMSGCINMMSELVRWSNVSVKFPHCCRKHTNRDECMKVHMVHIAISQPFCACIPIAFLHKKCISAAISIQVSLFDL